MDTDIANKQPTVSATYWLGTLPFLLLKMVSEKTGFVGNVQLWMKPEAGAESSLVEREHLIPRQTNDTLDVV